MTLTVSIPVRNDAARVSHPLDRAGGSGRFDRALPGLGDLVEL